MSINKEDLPLYIVALENKPIVAKVLISDCPFSKPCIQSYCTVISKGKNESFHIFRRDIRVFKESDYPSKGRNTAPAQQTQLKNTHILHILAIVHANPRPSTIIFVQSV
jgi:hypothetical protein